MTEPLPWKELRFCDSEEQARVAESFMERGGVDLPDDAEIGYALEVSLRYPEEKHSLFAEYPPLAQKRVVTEDEYSPFTKNLVEKNGLRPAPTPKLISDLHEKKKLQDSLRQPQIRPFLGSGIDGSASSGAVPTKTVARALHHAQQR